MDCCFSLECGNSFAAVVSPAQTAGQGRRHPRDRPKHEKPKQQRNCPTPKRSNSVCAKSPLSGTFHEARKSLQGVPYAGALHRIDQAHRIAARRNALVLVDAILPALLRNGFAPIFPDYTKFPGTTQNSDAPHLHERRPLSRAMTLWQNDRMRKRSSKNPVENEQPTPEQESPVPESAASASESPADGKNPAAVELGRLGGKKGGPARAKKLTPEQRREIAKRAAEARWNKNQSSDK